MSEECFRINQTINQRYYSLCSIFSFVRLKTCCISVRKSIRLLRAVNHQHKLPLMLYTQLTHKSERALSACAAASWAAVRKRSEVAFGGWPLNCTAYHCTVDSASELLKTRWYFAVNSNFLRRFEMNCGPLKVRRIVSERVALKLYRPGVRFREKLRSDCEFSHLNKNPLNTE